MVNQTPMAKVIMNNHPTGAIYFSRVSHNKDGSYAMRGVTAEKEKLPAVIFMLMQFPVVGIVVAACCLNLFSTQVMAAPYASNVRIDVGVVNGTVMNSQTVKVSKTLMNPILMSVANSDVKDGLGTLFIKGAELVKGEREQILIRVKNALPQSGVAMTEMYLGLWVDGRQVPLTVNAESGGIVLTIPDEFKLVELRAIGPLSIELPKLFRGGFNVDIGIDGQSSGQHY